MKEILGLLIPYYEKHIAAIKALDPDESTFKYILEHGIANGICGASEKVFKTNIYFMPWVYNNYVRGGSVWFREPKESIGRSGVIEALQVRVDIMKRLLAEAQQDEQ